MFLKLFKKINEVPVSIFGLVLVLALIITIFIIKSILSWNWDWKIVLSILTIMIAIIAIFQKIIIQWIKKDWSKLKVIDKRNFYQKSSREKVIYGRLLVKNTGLFSLKNIEAMVVKLNIENFLPCPLLWTHFPQGGARPIINPNQEVYLDLCFKHINSQNVPILAIKEGRGIYSNLEKGINKLKIVLFADNGYNKTFYCEVHWEGGEEFKIEFK